MKFRVKRSKAMVARSRVPATRDHLMPRSLGGFGGDSNIVAACRRCNSTRGSSLSWVPFHEQPAGERVVGVPMAGREA